MITICHPSDEVEYMLIVAELTREEIPFFIVGQYFGSLFPGVQISWYNERSIQVPKDYETRAIEVIRDLRKEDVRNEQSFTFMSKLRMLIEVIFFGWFFPAGIRKPSNKSLKNGTPNSGAP